MRCYVYRKLKLRKLRLIDIPEQADGSSVDRVKHEGNEDLLIYIEDCGCLRWECRSGIYATCHLHIIDIHLSWKVRCCCCCRKRRSRSNVCYWSSPGSG